MAKKVVMEGSKQAPAQYKIVVSNEGPYLLYGRAPLAQQFIMVDELGESWYYKKGSSFSTESNPTALCRCGSSKSKPYCDGSHIRHNWDSALTAPQDTLLSAAETIEGERLDLTDNESYCCYARFCDPGGGVWQQTIDSGDDEKMRRAIRQSSMCPSGRLMSWNRESGYPYEFDFAPSLGLLEDPQIGVSAGLWVRGGIAIETQSGYSYEVRNRVVLCRCGNSNNKPYCDGSHASLHWQDELQEEVRAERDRVAESV